MLLLLSSNPLAPDVPDQVGVSDDVVVRLNRTVADAVGLTDLVPDDFSQSVADPVGISDTAVGGIQRSVAITDSIGLTDANVIIEDDAATVTDTVGLSDATARTIDSVRAVADPVGVTDATVVIKRRFATDPVGLSDATVASNSRPLDLPSIDGAIDLTGIASLSLFDPVADELAIEVPSIDGSSAPSGVTLQTATTAAVVAAGAEVYAELWTAAGTLVSTLDDQVSVEWQDVHNDVGIGTLVLNRHDPDAAQLTVGRQVRCYLYGQHVYTWVIQAPPQMTVFDPADESAETVSVSGPGRAALTEDGLVYAPKGVDDPLNPAHRLYSFASPDYVEGMGWGPAIQQYRADQLDPNRRVLVEWTYQSAGPEPDTVEYVETPPPLGWPDPLAYWIWGSSDRTRLGFNFFRKTFTVSTASSVTFAVTGDNYHTLYLDGTAILGETTELSCWRKYKTAEIKLAPGTYTLAAVVENAPLDVEGPSQWNPAGFLCSVYTTNVSGEVLDVLCRSDSSWRALPYPATWPGWTPGRILIDMITEAQARGELTGFQYDFSAVSDSAGNPWPYTEGFSAPIGTTILDALNSLVEQGWIDYRVAPGGLVLQAFNADWSPTSGVTLQVTGEPATTNLESLEITPQTKPKTRLLVRWSSGMFQLDDAAAQATYGVKPLYVTIDAATRTEAERRARVILDNVKAPQDAIQASIAPVATTDRPYDGYLVGDKLTVPNRTGGSSAEKLLALTIAHDEQGNAIIGAELATRIAKRERENEELLQQLGSGTSGSDKVRWSLYQTEPLNS